NGVCRQHVDVVARWLLSPVAGFRRQRRHDGNFDVPSRIGALRIMAFRTVEGTVSIAGYDADRKAFTTLNGHEAFGGSFHDAEAPACQKMRAKTCNHGAGLACELCVRPRDGASASNDGDNRQLAQHHGRSMWFAGETISLKITSRRPRALKACAGKRQRA